MNEKYTSKLKLTDKRMNIIIEAAEKRREEHMKH